MRSARMQVGPSLHGSTSRYAARIGALAAFIWTATACDTFSTGGKSSGGASSSAPQVGTHQLVDVAACTAVPDPRHYAQAAFFWTDDPIETPDGDRTVERGVVLYGGKTETFDGFDDLWLLDLTHVGVPGVCPWVLLTSAARGTPTFGGALVHRPAAGVFALVGGFDAASSSEIAASSDVASLDLRALGAGFASDVDALPDQEFAVAQRGAEDCDGPQPMNVRYVEDCLKLYHRDVDPCDVDDLLDAYDEADLSFTEAEVQAVNYCTDDPYCDPDAVQGDVAASATAPGLGFFAAAYDPVGDAMQVHGGTTGCLMTASTPPLSTPSASMRRVLVPTACPMMWLT